MDKATYRAIEAHMLTHMTDPAHDPLHIYRVLYAALDIAAHEDGVDMDVLIAACLLHDIGRDRQYADPGLCHAREGGAMAYDWLLARGWPEDKAAHVRDAVSTHRFRGDNPPVSLEAKILFDADKLDATGAIAIARCFFYSALTGEPVYALTEDGRVRTDPQDEPSSFLQEYNFKLRKVFGAFHTARARRLAEERRRTGDAFYDAMLREIEGVHGTGQALLDKALD